LKNNIINSYCLDAFSGSGSLGLESLSRNAKHVTFIEYNKEIFQHLKKNILQFPISPSSVRLYHIKTEIWLKLYKNQKFDIIFLDPPFYTKLIFQCLYLINIYNNLKPHGLIYIECKKTTKLKKYIMNNWNILKKKETKRLQIYLIKKKYL